MNCTAEMFDQNKNVSEFVFRRIMHFSNWVNLQANDFRSFSHPYTKANCPFNSQSLSSVIYSLGRMGISWNLFPQEVMNRLIDGLFRFETCCNSQDFAKIIYGYVR